MGGMGPDHMAMPPAMGGMGGYGDDASSVYGWIIDHMANMPPEAMGDHMEPPEAMGTWSYGDDATPCMGGMGPDHMANMPPDCMGGMGPGPYGNDAARLYGWDEP